MVYQYSKPLYQWPIMGSTTLLWPFFFGGINLYRGGTQPRPERLRICDAAWNAASGGGVMRVDHSKMMGRIGIQP